MFVWLKTIVSAMTLFATPALAGAVDEVLAGTRPLTAVGPLDEQMVAGIDRFCLRELVASRDRRNEVWRRDFTHPARYAASVAPFRQRFLEAIGGVDQRLTATHPNRYGFEFLETMERSSGIARDAQVTVRRVRWQVLDGVTA